MRTLVQHWQQDLARELERSPRTIDAASNVRLAVRLIEDGLLSKGLARLSSKGMGNMELEPIMAQLRANTP
jgi:hypothetical protein